MGPVAPGAHDQQHARDNLTRLPPSAQPPFAPLPVSSSTVASFFSKLLKQSRLVTLEPETAPSYCSPTKASLAKDLRVEMATKENVPPVGSPQWYGSTVSSSLSDVTHASRHSTPKRTVQRTLTPMNTPVEASMYRPTSVQANTLGLTADGDGVDDEPLRRPLSEMSKAEVMARRRESKTKSPCPSKTSHSGKGIAATKNPAPATAQGDCVHKTRSPKTTTSHPVPSYAAPTSASRASATPSVRRTAKSPATPASPSKLPRRSPGKPVVRSRRNTLTKTPKGLRISTTFKTPPSISEKETACRRIEAWALATAVPPSPRRRSSANPAPRDPFNFPLSPKLPRERTRKAVEHARAKLAGDKAAMLGAKAVLDAGIKNGDSPGTLRTAGLREIGYNDTPRRTAHMANPSVSTPTQRAISTLHTKAGTKREARALLKASRNRVNGDAADIIAAAQVVLGGAVKDLKESRSPTAIPLPLAPQISEPDPVCCKCRSSFGMDVNASGTFTPSEKILIPASPPRSFLTPPFLADMGSLAAQLARRRESLTPVAPSLPPSALSAPSPSSTAPPSKTMSIAPTTEPTSMQAVLHATPAMLQAAAQGLKHIECRGSRPHFRCQPTHTLTLGDSLAFTLRTDHAEADDSRDAGAG
ncbi:hypothetical protein CC85DRAFT_311488 [Cutaneotrichosporon oleaginosum]|uniref:Uncharacterized protein n=1 Tax=Cutaneotrichosporon oleaginosum TaxID=879819 RepID=A0A0J0XRZ9_9TREE|nr:uncharacterized protein CC85DRAFT_311488 [Cutaneotrichosporon oleaginosum]KLT43883.1 hypothetical protein CC85DRAFT_311488 [Cutaneotrichosporon oleaginosum]TXT06377.1 hypothetical protein COLE_05708 [Cutaneotrichosporon oleaginosum]